MDVAHEALDSALATFHRTAAEYGGRLSNHGPMAAEALEAMGLQAEIPAFVHRYARRLEPCEHPGGPHVQRLLRDGVESVVRDALPGLLPGLAGAAFHGLIRTGHAMRGLRRRPSPVRVAELGHALDYWSAAAQVLPGEPGARAIAGTDAHAVFASTPLIPETDRAGGLIADRFNPLLDWDEFIDPVETLDLAARTPREHVLDVADLAARAYLQATSGRDRFVFLHVVTGSAALLTLLDTLSDEDARRGAGYMVQAAAAVKATHGHTLDPSLPWPDPCSASELAHLALRRLDDHDIKFAEACIRLGRETGQAHFGQAATRALT